MKRKLLEVGFIGYEFDDYDMYYDQDYGYVHEIAVLFDLPREGFIDYSSEKAYEVMLFMENILLGILDEEEM